MVTQPGDPAETLCDPDRPSTSPFRTLIRGGLLRHARRCQLAGGRVLPAPRGIGHGRSWVHAAARCSFAIARSMHFVQRRLWSTSRVIFDSRRKSEYPYTPRTRFSHRVAVAARGTHVENGDARGRVFRSTRASVWQLIEPTPTQDHWHALFRPRCSGFCLLRR